MTAQATTTRNGFDTEALKQVMAEIAVDPRKGAVAFGVSTAWKGGVLGETRVEGYTLGGQRIPRQFRILVDEPFELLGTNTQPNPQELLMAGLNSCMMVGYVAGASMHGIELECLEIETEGELDLRGFLGLDATVKPGYDTIHYTVRIKGNGTREQFEEIHRNVMATSPNRWNIANPIKLTSDLVVEGVEA